MQVYWLLVFACVLLCFVSAGLFSFSFLKGSIKNIRVLNELVYKFTELKKNDIANIEKFRIIIKKNVNNCIFVIWDKFEYDTKYMFKKKCVPEPKLYFTYESVFAIPLKEKKTNVLFSLLFLIGVICIAFPISYLFLTKQASDLANVQSCCLAILTGLVVIAFVFVIDYIIITNNKSNIELTLYNFNRALSMALPVVNESTQIALMLDTNVQSSKMFSEATKVLAEKIESYTFNGILPTVSNSFERSMATKLAPHIEEIKNLAEAVIYRQDNGMAELSNEFSNRLSEILDIKMNSFANSIVKLNAELTLLQKGIKDTVLSLDDSLRSDREVLKETIDINKKSCQDNALFIENVNKLVCMVEETGILVCENSINAKDALHSINEAFEHINIIEENIHNQLTLLNDTSNKSIKTLEDTKDSLNVIMCTMLSGTKETFDNSFAIYTDKITETLSIYSDCNAKSAESINMSMNNLVTSIPSNIESVFTRYSENLSKTLSDSIEANNVTSLKLSNTIDELAKAGTEQYEQAAKAAAKLLNDVVLEMNKAMDGVGHEIAESITKASLGSVEVVNRLAMKTEELKEEYDTYFKKFENHNNSYLEELEYRMQNILLRFTDDANNVMDKLATNISSAVNLFEGSTSALLQNLDEETRSIGLYAKDLSIDINELNSGLQNSVSVFTKHLQESTIKTFEEFDNGLAEVSNRLANTVESIRESVENLPNAISII